MSEWLQQSREALRSQKVQLNDGLSRADKTQAGIQIAGIINDSAFIHSLVPQFPSAQFEVRGLFIAGLRITLKRVIEAAIKGNQRELVDEVDFDDPAHLTLVARDYRGMVDVVTRLAKPSSRTFEKAAKITPYWSPEDIKEMLTIDHIAEHLAGKGIALERPEIEGLFTDSVLLELVSNFTADPLHAIKRAARNYKEELTLPKVVAHLKTLGIELSEDGLRPIFTVGVRRRLAIRNINTAFSAAQNLVTHLTRTLTTDNIQEYLEKQGISLSRAEVIQIFSDSMRLSLALKHARPLEAIKTVVTNFKTELSLPNIQRQLVVEGMRMDLEEIASIFTEGVRLHFAACYPSDPLRPVVDYVRGLESLSPQNIQSHLEVRGICLGVDEVGAIFTPGIRAKLALGYISDPLEAAFRVARHLHETLLSEGIQAYLSQHGVEYSIDEIDSIFLPSLRKKFAINAIDDPLAACLRHVQVGD